MVWWIKGSCSLEFAQHEQSTNIAMTQSTITHARQQKQWNTRKMNHRRGEFLSQWNQWLSGTMAQSINKAMEWIIALIGQWFAHQCVVTTGAIDKHTHGTMQQLHESAEIMKQHSIESMVLWIYESRIRSHKSAIEKWSSWSINRWSESMAHCIDASKTSKFRKRSHSNFDLMEQGLQNDQHVRVKKHINWSMCQLHMKHWM